MHLAICVSICIGLLLFSLPPSPETKDLIKSIVLVTIKSIFYGGNPRLKILLQRAPAQGRMSVMLRTGISGPRTVPGTQHLMKGWMGSLMN